MAPRRQHLVESNGPVWRFGAGPYSIGAECPAPVAVVSTTLEEKIVHRTSDTRRSTGSAA